MGSLVWTGAGVVAEGAPLLFTPGSAGAVRVGIPEASGFLCFGLTRGFTAAFFFFTTGRDRRIVDPLGGVGVEAPFIL